MAVESGHATKRAEEVIKLAEQTGDKHLTYREIGQIVGLSSSRVGQILKDDARRAWREMQQIVQEELAIGDREVLLLPLSFHLRRCLYDNGMVHVRDVLARSEVDLLQLYNFGLKSHRELQDFLHQHGLALTPRPPALPRMMYEKCPQCQGTGRTGRKVPLGE